MRRFTERSGCLSYPEAVVNKYNLKYTWINSVPLSFKNEDKNHATNLIVYRQRNTG
jgi:hypothetical protein